MIWKLKRANPLKTYGHLTGKCFAVGGTLVSCRRW